MPFTIPMPTLTIDDRTLTFTEGDTILHVAAAAGIPIPTLCHHPELGGTGGCMVCTVQDAATGRYLPACTARAMSGMQIRTETTSVRDARRRALEILLADHSGDCEAPCRMACPAQMEIPAMLRALTDENADKASQIVYRHIPLPRTLGHICPAPCERVCRRADVDAPIAICRLKRLAAEIGVTPQLPTLSDPARIAIIGAGPTGLSCAWHAAQHGHRSVIFDANPHPGGRMLDGPAPGRLPTAALATDIGFILSAGITLHAGQTIATPEELDAFDVIVLACGASGALRELATAFGLATGNHGVLFDAHTHLTNRPGLLAGGGCVRPMRLAVQAVAHGREMALTADQLLRGETPSRPSPPLLSRAGTLNDRERAALLCDSPHTRDADQTSDNESLEGAIQEAAFCLHCDCRKNDDCRLRELARQYGARQPGNRDDIRRVIEREDTHPEIIYESGKCIACGLCIAVTRDEHEPVGLTYLGRGASIKIGPPLNRTLAQAITHSATRCIATCPTGALSLRSDPA